MRPESGPRWPIAAKIILSTVNGVTIPAANGVRQHGSVRPNAMGARVQRSVDLGIHGVKAAAGEHLCGLYVGAEQRDELVVPFLRTGLAAGDKCICVVDGSEPGDVLAAVGPSGVEVQRGGGKQLDVMRSADLYLRSGRFSAPEIISAWKAAISEAMYDGAYDLVRAIQAWSLQVVIPDRRELLLLESELRRYLPLYPQVVVCLYDLGHFDGGIVVDLLKTHSRVLVNGMVLDNPYCLSLDQVLDGASERDDLADEREELADRCYAATTGST